MTLAHLPASTRSAAEQWATAAVRDVDPEIAPVLREQLLAAIGEALPAGARTEDVQEFADRFGPVQADLAGELVRSPLVGRLAGVPYDLHRPTAERIQHAWWDPSRPEILVPRAFGIGWDLNLGALAVRLGIIEPDAEDVPFASTPASAHWIAAALPAALAVAVIAHYTAREDLPAQLPRRWDRAGRPDRWMPRRDAAALDTAVALASAAASVAAAAAVTIMGSWRTAAPGVQAAAALTGSLAAGLTIHRSLRRPTWIAGPVQAAAALSAAGGTLYWLAREGRRVERSRDLDAKGPAT